MYNRFYEYLTKNNLLFDKQFEFRKGHSTEHALTELVNIRRPFKWKQIYIRSICRLAESIWYNQP